MPKRFKRIKIALNNNDLMDQACSLEFVRRINKESKTRSNLILDNNLKLIIIK